MIFMQSFGRRNILKWIGAAIAAVALRPIRALAGSRSQSQSRTIHSSLLTTQHFESGEAQMHTADSAALIAMVRDLHARRQYDASCHDGLCGPDGEYLSQWVDHVSFELESRGYAVADIIGQQHVA